MARPISASLSVIVAAAALAPALFGHDDDPMALRTPRDFHGPGLRTGAPNAQTLPGGSGPAFLSFANNGIRLMSWLSLQDLAGGDNGNSLWGYTSPSGREYACFGSQLGTHFVEVTDPSNPQIVGFISGPTSLWRDIRTYQHYAYAVSEGGNGIQVIDLANIDNGVVTLANTVTVGGSTTATHTVFVNEASGYLYRSGGGSHGIRVYSLANPALPVYVNSWDNKYSHEVTVVSYTSGPYAGKEIAFICGGDNGGWANTGLFIVDVTNKASMTQLSSLNYTGAQYSHQCWPTDDLHYLHLDDELDEYNGLTTTVTKVFDISNLSAPVQLPDFGNGNTAIGHNLYNKGNRHFEANYTSGLRVFDSTNPLAPTEIAWFDTYPENDANTFNALWNVYIYFQSGTVIGSDIDRGLFVWWVGPPKVSLAPASTPSIIQAVDQHIDVTLTEATPGDYQAGTAQLNVYTQSGGWQSSPLVALGGSAYRADFPSIPCGEAVQWYLSAKSTNGFTWTEPAGAPGVTNVTTPAVAASSVGSYDFESTAGWLGNAPGDNATAGVWVRGDPHSTTSAQTEDDHTDPTFQCWYTGDGTDVDGGTTSLVSPTFNLASADEAYLRYWRWYSNDKGPNPGQDTFEVQVSNNGGSNWTTVETVGPTGLQAHGGWYLHQFRVADFVAPNNNVKLRFIARDLGGDSEIEAAVDDVEALNVSCATSPTTYCVAKTASAGCLASMGSSGTASLTSASPFLVTASNVLNQKNGQLFYGFGSASAPFQGGTRCVQVPLVRTPLQSSAGSSGSPDCSGAFGLDFNARIQAGLDPNLIAGATVYAQYWYRDPADPAGFGTGLSNGLRFSIDL